MNPNMCACAFARSHRGGEQAAPQNEHIVPYRRHGTFVLPHPGAPLRGVSGDGACFDAAGVLRAAQVAVGKRREGRQTSTCLRLGKFRQSNLIIVMGFPNEKAVFGENSLAR